VVSTGLIKYVKYAGKVCVGVFFCQRKFLAREAFISYHHNIVDLNGRTVSKGAMAFGAEKIYKRQQESDN